MALTRLDALEFARAITGGDSEPSDDVKRVRAIEEALKKLPQIMQFDNFIRRGRINLKGPESTGTVELDVDRVTVTGTGTNFTSDMVGNIFQIDGDTMTHRIAAVNGTTELVLTHQYQSLTDTTFPAASTYRIVFYNFLIETDTREVSAVTRLDDGRELDEKSQQWIEAEIDRWQGLEINQPVYWAWRADHIDDPENPGQKLKENRILLYPPALNLHVVGYERQRYLEDIPASDTDELDVPDELELLFRGVLAQRLAMQSKAWTHAYALAKIDMEEQIELVRGRQEERAAPFTIGEEQDTSRPASRYLIEEAT